MDTREKAYRRYCREHPVRWSGGPSGYVWWQEYAGELCWVYSSSYRSRADCYRERRAAFEAEWGAADS